MKKILVVVEDTTLALPQITKALTFEPREIRVVILVKEDEEVDADLLKSIEASLSDLKSSKIELAEYSDERMKHSDVTWLLGRYKPELLVLGKGKGKLTGQLAAKKALLNKVKTGILVCSRRQWKKKARVLVTADCGGSNEGQLRLNRAVFSGAKKLAERLNATLYTLYVIALSRLGQELDIVEAGDVLSKKGKAAEGRLRKSLSDNKVDDYVAKVRAGIPAEEIVHHSRDIKADVLVMGNVGRKGIKGFVVGNTAETTLKKIPCDLLMLKQPHA